LAEGGIAVAPSFAFVFTRWIDGLAIWLWVQTQISPSPGGQQSPSNTMCHCTPQVYLQNGCLNPEIYTFLSTSNGLRVGLKCNSQRQTMGKCIGMGEIACAARGIPPNN